MLNEIVGISIVGQLGQLKIITENGGEERNLLHYHRRFSGLTELLMMKRRTMSHKLVIIAKEIE